MPTLAERPTCTVPVSTRNARGGGRSLALGRALGLALAVLALLSACSSVALVVLTSMLHGTNETISAAVERQQMTEDSHRDLFLRDRAGRPELRRRLVMDIVERMRHLETTAKDPEEAAAAGRAMAATAVLLASDASTSENEASAHDAITELDAIERRAVADARTRARALDDIANTVGVAAGVLVFGGSLAIVTWLNRRLVRPLLRIAKHIRAYGRGETKARAVEEGPRELRDMARAFNATADRVEEQRAAHATFLAGVAHDLRNPIQVLTMAVGLPRPSPSTTSPQVERILEIVRRQLPRLERLIADLLDTANLQAGRLELELAEHDLRDIASSTAALFHSASEQHEVSVDVPDAAVIARCDAHRVEQVLVNLVGNAIKYSPRGGAVRIAVRSDADKAVISVEDQGIGMTPEQAARAFQPFARAAPLRDSVPGHGLGLFIAERIVHEHGGAIRIESELGRGTVFRVELPAAGRERAPLHS